MPCWWAMAWSSAWRPSSPFRLPARIARLLGRTGINVMTRLMGLILAALAVEIMAEGLGKLFPILGAPMAR
jgi:small neutral amino acid transporter SnatA (MarC family)